MAYIVRCPQCHEVNLGSLLFCEKCQTSLIGIPREQVPSAIPETSVDQKPKENIFQKADREQLITVGVLSSIYVLAAFFTLISALLRSEENFQFLAFTLVLFIIGVLLYLTPADILYRIERNSGLFRPRLGPFENSGFYRAADSYPILGVILMVAAIMLNGIPLLI